MLVWLKDLQSNWLSWLAVALTLVVSSASCTLALAMRTVAAGGGLTLTVPVSDPDASTSAGSAVLWDEKSASAMFGDLARGDTSDLQQYVR